MKRRVQDIRNGQWITLGWNWLWDDEDEALILLESSPSAGERNDAALDLLLIEKAQYALDAAGEAQ